MAERVRLRLSGEEPLAPLEVAADPAPIGCIALAGAHGGIDPEPMARALAEGRPVARWRAIVRVREGAETIEKDGETIVRASPAEIDAALDALRADALAVAIGSAFVARRRPRLAILITGGAGPVQWEPSIRAIRDRFDLVIDEARPALARELAQRLWLREPAP